MNVFAYLKKKYCTYFPFFLQNMKKFWDFRFTKTLERLDW